MYLSWCNVTVSDSEIFTVLYSFYALLLVTLDQGGYSAR